ncbi:MAG: 2,3-bisphosphoglycerate-independent phosphoglycerate mutase [Coriobacteriia bacterium]|nr:2,3-bisphosphoglycerate-independent phosphoglycerate mutase [Coriobacteriia bacterium]
MCADGVVRVRNLPVCLAILDGFGFGEEGPGNAVRVASKPNLDAIFAEWPHTTLSASGRSVGLPDGQMGNSEVGHLNIGAGRVVHQELTRIDMAIEDGTLFGNTTLAHAMDDAARTGHAVHLMGLVSPGGVHSHTRHLYALARMAAARGVKKLPVHAILDGRDTPPESGLGYIAKLESELAAVGLGEITTVMGRYWAMDRDARWERVERAWRAIVLGSAAAPNAPPAAPPDGSAAAAPSAAATAAVAASYAAGVTDEFMEPVVIRHTPVVSGDVVVFFNFRPDRAREITRAFTDQQFDGFARPVVPAVRFVCLTEYDPLISAEVAFPKELPKHVLADVLAEQGLTQLHIAETEKYAHVTFFLNGGVEPPKEGESRILIPSPKAATYDLQPEMSAPEVTRRLVEAIKADAADVYIVNYANCDMVGHTGVFDAAVAAVEAVDEGIGAVFSAIREKGGAMLIAADHGNAERMVEDDGVTPFTAHTVSPVPFAVMAEGVIGLRDGGVLADVAPTLLDVIGVEIPAEWTGRNLLVY